MTRPLGGNVAIQAVQVLEVPRPNGGRPVIEDPKDQGTISARGAVGAHADQPRRTHAFRGGAYEDEAELLAKVALGHQSAFRILVDRHLPAVEAVARRLITDASEAEDVAQDTFLRLWQRADQLDVGGAGVRPWLRQVSRNLAIDRLRSAKRLDVVADVPEFGEDATQHDQIEDAERSDHVADALAALPDRQRVALTLFHFEELSQIEVADVLSCSVEAVESLLSRARRRLKSELRDSWRSLLNDTDDTL